MGVRTRPTPEQRREWQRDRRARAIERFLMLNEHPTCECGCEGRVRFDAEGRPNRFVLGHYQPDSVEIVAFRKAVFKLKEQRGWSGHYLADRGGISYNHYQELMYGNRRKGVTREWARDFLRRLAGQSAPATTWMKREIAQDHRIGKEMNTEQW